MNGAGQFTLGAALALALAVAIPALPLPSPLEVAIVMPPASRAASSSPLPTPRARSWHEARVLSSCPAYKAPAAAPSMIAAGERVLFTCPNDPNVYEARP